MTQGGLFEPDWCVRLDELLAQAGTGPLHECCVNVRTNGMNVSYRVTAAVKSEVISLLREYAPDRLVYPEEAA